MMIDTSNNFTAYKAANTFKIDNTFNVYTGYLLWLVQKTENCSTKELLMQVYIINAYVISALEFNIKNSSDDNNHITIREAATTQNISDLTTMLQKLDADVISAVRTVTHSRFYKQLGLGLLALSIVTGVLIGCMFIPYIPFALFMTLFTISPYFAVNTAIVVFGALTYEKTYNNVIFLDKPVFDTPDLIKVQTDAIDVCTGKMLNAKTTDLQDKHHNTAAIMTFHFAMKSWYVGRDDKGNEILLSERQKNDQIIPAKNINPANFKYQMGLT